MAEGKITRAHTSRIEEAEPLIKAAQKSPAVTKISLGIIKKVRRGKGIRRLKFTEITGGIKVRVRGTAVVQEIYIYTSDSEYTKTLLTRAFEKS